MSKVDNKKILESIQFLQKTIAENAEQVRADILTIWKEIFILKDEMAIINKKIADNQVIMEKYENLSTTCNALQQRWNNLEQSQLKCHMEISGIPSSEINSKKHVIQIAFETLTRYDKTLKITDIKEASRRYRMINRENTTVIDVAFASYDVKMRVMKRKLHVDKGQSTNIFVGHSLTHQNRNLFLQARKIAKILHKKCYIVDGRTYMKNQEDLRGIQIKSSSDLEKIQSGGCLTSSREAKPML